jgi:hypothetical protein
MKTVLHLSGLLCYFISSLNWCDPSTTLGAQRKASMELYVTLALGAYMKEE